MAKENTRAERLKYAFGAHPSVKEFHVTSDDQMFVEANNAANHAKTLENKDVEVAKRSDYVKSTAPSAPENQLDLEREALKAKHKELFGKDPAPNFNLDKLKKKITDEEAKLKQEAASADTAQAGQGAEGGDDEGNKD